MALAVACGGEDGSGLSGGSGGSGTGGSAGSGGGSAGVGASGGGAGSAGSAGSGATGGGAGTSSGGSAGSAAGGSAGSAGSSGSAGSAGGGSYTVGGTVSGLIGSGLTLQNNGADNLTIPQDGPFTFATPLATGQTYAVSVLTEPSAPAQECSVVNGTGQMGTANVSNVQVSCKLADGDNDGVPDAADPFPTDPTKPQLAEPKRVYPHTSSKLFAMDVDTYQITEIGPFNGALFPSSMTDLAVDQFGVIYGVTFNNLFTCDAKTATCYSLAGLPQSFNGLTMLPAGTHHPYLDTLVGIANSGAWYKVSLTGSGAAQLTQIGSYGSGYTSSGDAFSIEGVGTFGAVDKSGTSSDVIVSVDPMTGAVKSEIGPVTGYSSLYGLAGWQGVVFGFDASGAVLQIDIQTGAATLLQQTSNSWWGAGVATRLSTTTP